MSNPEPVWRALTREQQERLVAHFDIPGGVDRVSGALQRHGIHWALAGDKLLGLHIIGTCTMGSEAGAAINFFASNTVIANYLAHIALGDTQRRSAESKMGNLFEALLSISATDVVVSSENCAGPTLVNAKDEFDDRSFTMMSLLRSQRIVHEVIKFANGGRPWTSGAEKPIETLAEQFREQFDKKPGEEMTGASAAAAGALSVETFNGLVVANGNKQLGSRPLVVVEYASRAGKLQPVIACFNCGTPILTTTDVCKCTNIQESGSSNPRRCHIQGLKLNRLTKTSAVNGVSEIAQWTCCGATAVKLDPSTTPARIAVIRESDNGCCEVAVSDAAAAPAAAAH